MNRKQEIDKRFHQTAYANYLLSYPQEIINPKNYYNNIRILLLYLRDVLGLKPKLREEYIYELLKQIDPNFNEVTDYKKIDKILKGTSAKEYKIIDAVKTRVYKHNLKDCCPMYIYKSEFDFINSLTDNKNQRKLLFAILCFWKIRNAVYKVDLNNFYIPNYVVTIPCLKRTSRITLGEKETIGYLFYDLRQLDYINYTPYGKGGIIAKFLENLPKTNEEELKIEITDIEDIGLYFEYFINLDKFKFCEKCGSIYRVNNSSQHGGDRNNKYCKFCKKEQTTYLKLIRCQNCGQAKFISTKSRRKEILCDDCYEKIRQIKKNNY